METLEGDLTLNIKQQMCFCVNGVKLWVAQLNASKGWTYVFECTEHKNVTFSPKENVGKVINNHFSIFLMY